MEKEILEILRTINGRFDGLEGRFDKLENKVDKIEEGQEKIVARLDGIDVRLEGIDVRLDGIDVRLDGIDVRLDNLENGQKQIKDKLDDMSEDITRELSNIAAKVSGVDEITIKNAHHIIDLDIELIKLKSMH